MTAVSVSLLAGLPGADSSSRAAHACCARCHARARCSTADPLSGQSLQPTQPPAPLSFWFCVPCLADPSFVVRARWPFPSASEPSKKQKEWRAAIMQPTGSSRIQLWVPELAREGGRGGVRDLLRPRCGSGRERELQELVGEKRVGRRESRSLMRKVNAQQTAVVCRTEMISMFKFTTKFV